MIPILIAIGLVIILGLVLVMIRVERKRFIRRELIDIVEKCTSIESGLNRGYAKFEPSEDETYLYEILVSNGVMRRNPLGGYSLTSSRSKTLDLVNGEVVTVRDKTNPELESFPSMKEGKS